ncbi:MAG: prepilin-type N-terminal cleavage/methylation domain-containing protein [Candidatus Electrothrix sp. AW2]|nr:prepilin-type N-terminal cleavage/methylation domain-containing protein [Candidatus Electrothrix gigas]
MSRRKQKENGFSLLEVMVSMVIVSFITIGMYGVYTIQQRSYTVQEQVSEMQQKGRAALDFMVRDLRMAGFDSLDGTCSSGLITAADEADITFPTCDDNDTKATKVRYYLDDAYKSNGMNNGVSDDLFRVEDKGAGFGNPQLIAEGVDALEFRYLDEDGNELIPFNAQQVRSIQISLLIRATHPDRKYTDTIHHVPASGNPAWDIQNSATNPPNDNFHRWLLVTTVKLRNMGF